MRLGSSDTDDTDDTGRTAAETEADERRADGAVTDEGTAAQPTFTPAARRPGDDVADDTAGRNPAVAEPGDPAGEYRDAGEYRNTGEYRNAGDSAVPTGERAGAYEDNADAADRPVVRYAQVETVQTVQPTGNYQPGETATPAGNYTTPDTEAPVSGYGQTTTDTGAPGAVGTPAAAPAAAGGADLEQPLLSGNTELLQQWQHVQAQFVEDPQVAVSGAADLVEQAAHALVDALEQRQRQMRGLWDRNGAAPGENPVDTEQMRQMMQRYRALFNQLYQPV